ncbi:MAG: LytTR family transcriptional regulator [Roseivirga sp.]|nr:LytTR family transcriptional regulator [Roseivirga sp.]
MTVDKVLSIPNLPYWTENRPSRFLGAFLFWTLMAALFTTKSNLYYTFKGVPTSWLHLSIHHITPAWVWLAFMPLVLTLYRRISAANHTAIIKVVWLLSGLVVLSVAHRFLALSADIAFRKLMGYIDGSIWQNLVKTDSIFIAGVFDSALVLTLMLTFFHARKVIGSGLLKRRSEGISLEQESPGSIMVKNNGCYEFLNLANLISVAAAGNYVKVTLTEEKPILIRQTLKDFYTQLPEGEFLRINRSFILNVNFVKSLQPRYNGDYTITLTDGSVAHTSRAYGKQWKQLLSS